MLDHEKQEQLDNAWKVIWIMLGTIIAVQTVFLLSCKFFADQLNGDGEKYPIETFRIALYSISTLTIVIVFYVRKAMLKIPFRVATSSILNTYIQHPAAVRYASAVGLATILCNTISTFAGPFYLLSRDSFTLYLLIAIQALFIFLYGPRKEELMQFVEEYEKHKLGRNG